MELIEAINDIAFDLELPLESLDFDNTDINEIESFVDFTTRKHQSTSSSELPDSIKSLATWVTQKRENYIELSRDVYKEVYVMLKDRALHPTGSFDKAGRFYLKDSELVDCRRPSAKYPYTQMNAARTASFVKAISRKYACSSKEELLSRFKKAT